MVLCIYSKFMRIMHDAVNLELVVEDASQVADDVRAIRFSRADGGSLPAWRPGAHIDLIQDHLTRQYSLCGDPLDPREWTVAILHEPGSPGGSAYFHDTLERGATVQARGPRNHFPLINAPVYLFIAGGIGITPLVPMISEISKRRLPWRLVYGGRTRSAMAYADELTAAHGSLVTLVPEDELGQLHVPGLLQGLNHDGTAIYCCGPEGLVNAVETMHATCGRGSLHVERFEPRAVDPAPSAGAFEVETARSGKIINVEAGISILDALTSAGVRVLNSCRDGICGTCELNVLSGVPDHRDSILTEDERRASKTMFPCVSRCLSPRLVLDV